MQIARQFKIPAQGPSFTFYLDGSIFVRIQDKLFVIDLKDFNVQSTQQTVNFQFGVIFAFKQQIIEISDEIYSYSIANFERTTVQHLKSPLQTYFSCQDQIFVVFDNSLYQYQISSNQFDFILKIPYFFTRGITTRKGDVLTISQLQYQTSALDYSIMVDLCDQTVMKTSPATPGILGDVVFYRQEYATLGSIYPGDQESSLIRAGNDQISTQNALTGCGCTVYNKTLYVTDRGGEVYEIKGDFVDQDRNPLLIVKNAQIEQRVEYTQNKNSKEKVLIHRVQELMRRIFLYRNGRENEIYQSSECQCEWKMQKLQLQNEIIGLKKRIQQLEQQAERKYDQQ